MGNIIVAYKSKYGFTTKYANLLAKKLSCQTIELNTENVGQLERYDTIIYLGGIYASKVNGLDIIMKNKQLVSKKLIIGMVGVTDVNDTDKINSFIIDNKLNDSNIKVFYLHGGLNYQILKLPHKMIINILVTSFKKKKDSTNFEKELANVKNKPVDYTNETAIIPIIDYLNEISK